MDFCASFGCGDTFDHFLPNVTSRLRERDPVAYASSLPGINRQKLHRRLWAGLKRQVAKLDEDSTLRQAFLRDKGIKVHHTHHRTRSDWASEQEKGTRHSLNLEPPSSPSLVSCVGPRCVVRPWPPCRVTCVRWCPS